MKKIEFLGFFLGLFANYCSSPAFSCMAGGKHLDRSKIGKVFQKHQKRGPAVSRIAAFSEGHSSPSLESQLGNLLLRHQVLSPGTSRVVISIPAQILRSNYNPFGDGQTNAKMTFGPYWKEAGFPVIGFEETKTDGSKKRRYEFHSKLNGMGFDEISLGDGWYEVKLKGWSDSFYFHFDAGTLKLNDFLSGIPASLRTFSGGRVAPNPGKVGPANPFQDLKTKNLGAGYNTNPWYADSVHGRFPSKDGQKTALGGVLTWGIVNSDFGPFKHLYTCFESRNAQQEKLEGVPSGAGWHHIGDPAETLLHTLEKAPLIYAMAQTHGRPHASYQLSEVITAVWLNPGEVAVAQQGQFHWYLNPYEKEVCTEIWVHKCVINPSNNWGFNCR